MVMPLMVGLEPPDIESPHTARYHVALYKHGESATNTETGVTAPLQPQLPIMATFNRGRKYISRRAVLSGSEPVL
jgi:hypothetical protein